MTVIELIDMILKKDTQHAYTATIYAEHGTELFKNNVYNLPYHILESKIQSWDMEKYHITIRLYN